MKTSFTILILALISLSIKAQNKHLFLLSGQSNMGNLDPSTSFKPIIRAAFPNDEVYFAKWAKGGNSIRNWIDEDEEGNLKTHRHFITLNRLASDELAKNNIQKSDLTTVTFLWMQGEADHDTTKNNSIDRVHKYRDHLLGLIKALENEYSAAKLNIVIGRLNDARLKPGTDEWRKNNWLAIRKIQEEVAMQYARGAWIMTDDVNDDYMTLKDENGNVVLDVEGNKVYQYIRGRIGYDVHGSDLGYKKMGIRFATEAIELITGIRPDINEDRFKIRCTDGLDNYKGNWVLPIVDPTYDTLDPTGSCSNEPVPYKDIFPDIANSLKQNREDSAFYPNPTGNSITIELNQSAGYMLYNNLGKLINRGNLTEGTNTLCLSAYSPGIYIVTIETQTGYKTHRILKLAS